MHFPFFKYHGAGNDFVIFDNTKSTLPENFETRQKLIERICHRHFGVGADGLMILNHHKNLDFEMLYFNSDGFPGSMCGNGGRCLVALAHHLGLIKDETQFNAPDGLHTARVNTIEQDVYDISLMMNKPTDIHILDKKENLFDVKPEELLDTTEKSEMFLNTGSPHHVVFVKNVDNIDVFEEGRKIRYAQRYRQRGTNVNFVQIKDDHLKIRTYERGVENETRACGTGITAAALAAHMKGIVFPKNQYPLRAKGGKLKVSFTYEITQGYTNIILTGPAEKVFEGRIKLPAKL